MDAAGRRHPSDYETWGDEFVPATPPPPPPRPKPRGRADDAYVDVQARLAGTIIGRGGATIRGLQRDSRAVVSVIDSETYGMKTVRISGTAEARDVARKLLRDLIDGGGRGRRAEDAAARQVENDAAARQVENDAAGATSESEWDYDEIQRQHAEVQKKLLAAMPKIVKNVYREHGEVAALSDQQAADFRLSKNNIMVRHTDESDDRPISKPVLKFAHAFEDYPEIMKEIQKQKFETPSPVQCQAWPIIMSGHDLIAIAQTGTGKTLAFLLPAFIHIDFQPTPRKQRKGPTVLVLAPTRELVVQIESEVKKYSYKGIKSMSIYGGVSGEKQKECLLEGVEIVIATPGRLNDFVKRNLIVLSDVSYLVLDEADRMLDLGFEPQIRCALLTVRADRQTVMTSATWPSGVKRLARSYTNNSIQIVVGSMDLTTVNTVKQDILIMEQEEKNSWLLDFLKNIKEEDKVIVFVNRKVDVDELSIYLCLNGLNAESIHGGREQCDREMALENVRSGSTRILIATDVASRGIDIEDVTIVINYDLVKDIEEYVHRVGRSGRAGKTGLAITLVTKYDWGKAKDLVELMEKSGQMVPEKLYDMARRFEAKQKEKVEGDNRPFSGRGRGRGYHGNKYRNN